MTTVKLALGCGILLLMFGCDARPPVSAAPSCLPGEEPPDAAAPRVPWDGGFSDGTSNPFLAGPGAMVTVANGLRADLEAATGKRLATYGFADTIEVQPGYGVDLVFMRSGSLGPPPGQELTSGELYPVVLYFGGYNGVAGDPSLPPHREYAPARTLFEAMTNVPERGTEEGRTRESPNHRVVCSVPLNHDSVYCRFTGVLRTQVF
jgi:hypothetical protein